jgi:signal transduction histidine kinase
MKLVERNTIIGQQEKLTHFERLAAGVAHEIRNPLTTISARLHTIQRKLSEDTPERKDATVIGNEIERINTILKDFIQLTRPAPPNLALMTAEPLLKDVSDLMAPQFQRQAVRLECQLQGRAQFNGDYQQLKQVLINLLQNAAESIGRDGRVTLRARDGATLLKGMQTKVAIIEVEDNGPGIRPEVQGRLFEAFFSTKKGGTGLGLPISARIIDRHGGTLDFETEVGRGTVFRIVLPAL